MMLRRTFYQTKKKEKKLEIDKLQSAFVTLVELSLKEGNRKNQADLVNLNNLKSNFSFKMSKDGKEFCQKIRVEVSEYVKILNEYEKFKNLEDRAKVSFAMTNILKAKKAKPIAAQKKDDTTFQI